MNVPRPLRVAFLWTGPSAYLATGLSALEDCGAEVLLVCEEPGEAARAAMGRLRLSIELAWTGAPAWELLQARLEAFNPDVLLTTSWHLATYRRAARRWRRRGALTVLCMDNQWRGSGRQYLGVAIFRLRWRSNWDVAFLGGRRQAEFARRLGFSDRDQWRGLYPSDVGPALQAKRPQFFFAGRLVHEKAVDVLVEAYSRYRVSVGEKAWPLVVAGSGPLVHLLNEPGIQHYGFLQHEALSIEFHRSRCVVLASRFEPWGVALQEGAQAGCVLVASEAVGAAVHLLHDGENGFLARMGDTDSLVDAMVRITGLPPDALDAMGSRSRELGAPYAARPWAERFLQRVQARGL